MNISDKEITRAYEPYRKEALYILIIYALYELGITVFFIPVYFVTGRDPAFFILLPGILLFFAVFAVLVNFRLAILSKIEERRNLYIRKEVEITDLRGESDLYGKWNNILPKLYPEHLGVDRHKILCIGPDGKKLTLRSAMSLKNAWLLADEIIKETGKKRTVLYGKYTHIIVKYCDGDDTAFRLSRLL